MLYIFREPPALNRNLPFFVQRDDTIVAPLHPAGQGAVTLLRVSGPSSLDVLRALTRPHRPPVTSSVSPVSPVSPAPPARQARFVALWDGDQLLDRALVTWFPGPHSYTGEDSAEFSLHASPYVVQRFLALCTDLPGVRMAGPGEFTWRAFANGKMDLSSGRSDRSRKPHGSSFGDEPIGRGICP